MEPQKKNIPLADEKIQELADKARSQGKEVFAKDKNVVFPSKKGLSLDAKKEKSPIKNLRTYQGDIADIIQDQNASVLTIAMAEEKKKQEKEKKEPRQKNKIDPETKKNVFLAIGSFVLILLGIGAIAGFYFLQKKDIPIASQQTTEQSIISYNEKRPYEISDFSKQKILEIINLEKDRWSGAEDGVLFIELVKTDSSKAGPLDLFSGFSTRAPASLLRSFGREMMLGLFQKSTRHPFLLIEISSFENAFDGMLRWENNMYSDIGTIFSVKTVNIMPATPGEEGGVDEESAVIVNFEAEIKKEFEDLTVKNKDARILRNEIGETVLLYAFLNNQTLLIAGNEAVFRSFIEKSIPTRFLR